MYQLIGLSAILYGILFSEKSPIHFKSNPKKLKKKKKGNTNPQQGKQKNCKKKKKKIFFIPIQFSSGQTKEGPLFCWVTGAEWVLSLGFKWGLKMRLVCFQFSQETWRMKGASLFRNCREAAGGIVNPESACLAWRREDMSQHLSSGAAGWGWHSEVPQRAGGWQSSLLGKPWIIKEFLSVLSLTCPWLSRCLPFSWDVGDGVMCSCGRAEVMLNHSQQQRKAPPPL